MKKILLICSLCAFFVVAGCRGTTPAARGIASVKFGDHSIIVTEATTREAQSRGLGGVTELSWDQGMLFTFPDLQQRTFWMKNMLIPIDIIWLVDDRIVGIDENVQQPTLGTADKDLPLYTSPTPVDRVLEVRAGFSDRYKIEPGYIVKFE